MNIRNRQLVALFALGIYAASPRLVAGQSVTAGTEGRTWAVLPSGLASDANPAGPPPNLIGAPEVHQLAVEMWRGSSTFRRQSARLAAAPGLQITIRQGLPRRDGQSRAETTCRRERGTLVHAEMWIPVGVDAVELLAHEIEHIIEQLDEVDLVALEKQAGFGVRASSAGHFETVRAIAVGRLVAKEMRNRPVVMAAR